MYTRIALEMIASFAEEGVHCSMQGKKQQEPSLEVHQYPELAGDICAVLKHARRTAEVLFLSNIPRNPASAVGGFTYSWTNAGNCW